MNTYLSTEKIKALKEYLNTVLPNKTRATLLKIKLKTGLELYEDDKTNTRVFWEYVNREIKNLNNDISVSYNSEMSKGNYNSAGAIVTAYIEKNYNAEWQIATELNSKSVRMFINDADNRGGQSGFIIRDYLNTFCNRNNVEPLNINDCVECQNFDEILSKYERQNVDKDLLKRTDEMIKAIEIFYKGIEIGTNEYHIIRNASDIWLQTKDKDQLHNFINAG